MASIVLRKLALGGNAGRLYAQVPREVYDRWCREIPHGLRSKILGVIVVQLLNMYEVYPDILGMLLSGKFRLDIKPVAEDVRSGNDD